MEGPWSLKKISGEDWDRVINKMVECRGIIHSELPTRKKGHPTPIVSFCDEAQSRLETVKEADWMKDGLDLFSFRITKQKRLWCIEQTLNPKQAIYKILWWDPDHTVVPYKGGQK